MFSIQLLLVSVSQMLVFENGLIDLISFTLNVRKVVGTTRPSDGSED